MAELVRDTRTDLDLSSEVEVLAYTYELETTREVICRVNLGDGTNDLAGDGGIYSLRFYLNNVLITPNSEVTVPAATTRTIMVSRAIPLEPDDEVSVRVLGQPSDTQVNTTATLRDATPIVLGDLLGVSSVSVNHDYGGTDNLTYQTSVGVGVVGAQILCYLKSDYDAGLNSSQYVRATTTTVSDGHWAASFLLEPNTEYTLIYVQPGAYGPDRRNITTGDS